jgi:hypothetical protein
MPGLQQPQFVTVSETEIAEHCYANGGPNADAAKSRRLRRNQRGKNDLWSRRGRPLVKLQAVARSQPQNGVRLRMAAASVPSSR